MFCFLSCNRACSFPRALVRSFVSSLWSRSPGKAVWFSASARSQCAAVPPPASRCRDLPLPQTPDWLLDWSPPSERLFSPLAHSLHSHLFLHVIEVNCSLIKTVPSASISYRIIITTHCILLLLKVNWLCMSQGFYTGPCSVESNLWMRPLGSPWKPNKQMIALLCDSDCVCCTHCHPDIFLAPSRDVVPN